MKTELKNKVKIKYRHCNGQVEIFKLTNIDGGLYTDEEVKTMSDPSFNILDDGEIWPAWKPSNGDVWEIIKSKKK